MQRPAERALLTGLRAYDDGQYADAERELKRALERRPRQRQGPRHRAQAPGLRLLHQPAHAGLRERRSATPARADPEFALSSAEAGHPLWGPVYKRIALAPAANVSAAT